MAGPLRDPGPQARDRLRSMAAGADAGAPAAGSPDAAASAAGSSDPRPAAGTAAPGGVEALPDAPVDAVDDWSLDQLHRRASEVDLDGRWEMTRDQLIAALRQTP